MIGLEAFFKAHIFNIKRNIKPTDSFSMVKKKLAKFDDFPTDFTYIYLIQMLNKYNIKYNKKQRIGKYEDKKSQILKMYRDKEKLITISRKTEVPIQTVRNIITREYGECKSFSYLTEETWEEIAKKYESGDSLESLSIEYSVSMPNISTHIKDKTTIRKQGERINGRNNQQES